MSWTTILALAAGAYLLKAAGLLIFGPAMLGAGGSADPQPDSDSGSQSARVGLPMRIGQLLPPALLAALVVSQTVVSGTDLVLDARIAGVVAGGVAVWRKAPFWAVLLIAAAVSAAIRLISS